ncbi:hypothetical protein Afe04nite_56600 [Asanoa ferruginea]|nr:hypothetical protein Afe04nite_56600 [Asanoa ferruginea]
MVARSEGGQVAKDDRRTRTFDRKGNPQGEFREGQQKAPGAKNAAAQPRPTKSPATPPPSGKTK